MKRKEKMKKKNLRQKMYARTSHFLFLFAYIQLLCGKVLRKQFLYFILYSLTACYFRLCLCVAFFWLKCKIDA